MIYKTLHRKLMIAQREPYTHRGEIRCSGRENTACFTGKTRPVNVNETHITRYGEHQYV